MDLPLPSTANTNVAPPSIFDEATGYGYEADVDTLDHAIAPPAADGVIDESLELAGDTYTPGDTSIVPSVLHKKAEKPSKKNWLTEAKQRRSP